MAAVQKITVEVPAALLDQACAYTGEGVTATVREGLRLLASRSAQRELMKRRGKVRFSRTWEELKDDR
jgi:hypothetical protein